MGEGSMIYSQQPLISICASIILLVLSDCGRSIQLFQQLLYQDRLFQCSNEVHARLGLMFKILKNFDASLKVTGPLSLCWQPRCYIAVCISQHPVSYVFRIFGLCYRLYLLSVCMAIRLRCCLCGQQITTFALSLCCLHYHHDVSAILLSFWSTD